MNNLIPARVPIGQPHIICEQNRYTVLSTGQVVTKNMYNQSFNGDALAQALRFHGFPGVVVQVIGDQHRGVSINNPNGNLTHTVKWTTGNVSNVTIVGAEKNMQSKVGGIAVFNGAGDLRIQNLTLMNGGESSTPFIVNQFGTVGRMTLYDLMFLPRNPNAWGGKGMKWNIRGHGPAGWDCRNLKFHKAVEHGGYIDNHQGDAYFVNCVGGEMGRTFLQLVNRVQSGAQAWGKLVISKCISSNVGGGGGSDYTIVGNGEDPIYFLDNESIGSTQGAFVHWSDGGHGLYPTSNGFSSRQLSISNFSVNSPNANRDHVMISGVEEVLISDWNITGNKTAVALDTVYGGGIDNGTVSFVSNVPPSQNPGWNAWRKVTRKVGNLTDQQIDQMWDERGRGN